MKKNIILEKIYYSFNNEVPIINDLSFEFPSGQTVAILGHSGCGKSTLLQMISGILKPISGNIMIDNNKDLLGNISYMQQNDLLFPWLTVKENVLLPLKILGDKSQSSYDDVIEKSKILGINEYIDFYPNELSGGLKQRAAFLRTIIQRSEFILLDEPFASLDAITRMELYIWLEQLKKYIKKSIILVTHDIDEAIFLSDKVIIMGSGKNNFRFQKDISMPHPRGSNINMSSQFLEIRKDLYSKLKEVK